MRVWFSCFLVLFMLSELFQWMKQLSLPLPVFILGGAFLAITSNYDRRAGFPFNVLNRLESSQEVLPEAPASRPISFKIRKPEN